MLFLRAAFSSWILLLGETPRHGAGVVSLRWRDNCLLHNAHSATKRRGYQHTSTRVLITRSPVPLAIRQRVFFATTSKEDAFSKFADSSTQKRETQTERRQPEKTAKEVKAEEDEEMEMLDNELLYQAAARSLRNESKKTVPPLPKTEEEFSEYIQKPGLMSSFTSISDEEPPLEEAPATDVGEEGMSFRPEEMTDDIETAEETEPKDSSRQEIEQPFNLSKRPTTEAIFNALFGSSKDETQQETPPATDQQLSQRLEQVLHAPRRKTLDELAYWDLYPTQVKRWLVYTKTPRGRYDADGRWFSVLKEQPKEIEPVVSRDQNPQDWNHWEAIFKREQEELPEHLRNVFRFGVTAEELRNVHPRLRRLFSLRRATPHEVTSAVKQQLMRKWRLHDGDTGSSQVQIAALTVRINTLIEHLRKNRADNDNKRRLQILLRRRRGLMRHLKKNDIATYYALLIDLGLRDSVEIY
jgi:small subunit ribosomal protein S15